MMKTFSAKPKDIQRTWHVIIACLAAATGQSHCRRPAMIGEPGAGPQLEFPLDWQGRIVAKAEATGVPEAIGQALRAFGLSAAPSLANRSSQGRYVTYAVRLTIPDRVTWQQVCYVLSRIEGVRSVF